MQLYAIPVLALSPGRHGWLKHLELSAARRVRGDLLIPKALHM